MGGGGEGEGEEGGGRGRGGGDGRGTLSGEVEGGTELPYFIKMLINKLRLQMSIHSNEFMNHVWQSQVENEH